MSSEKGKPQLNGQAKEVEKVYFETGVTGVVNNRSIWDDFSNNVS